MHITISVIVPARNAASTLPRALDSITLQRQVTAPVPFHTEVIVIDDASQDNTYQIAKRHPSVSKTLRIPKQSGPSAARNLGIRASGGSHVAFLDADDRWTEGSLDVRLKAVLSLVTPAAVQGRFGEVPLELDERRLFEGVGTRSETPSDRPGFLLGTCLVSRDVFESAGLFDEQMRIYEDTEWWTRVRNSGASNSQVEQTCLVYRRSANSLSGGTNLRTELFSELRRRSAVSVKPGK